MRRFKHKKSGWEARQEPHDPTRYGIRDSTGGFCYMVPSLIIEETQDWEEVREPSFVVISQADDKIHSVRRVSDGLVVSVGDRARPTKDVTFDTIKCLLPEENTGDLVCEFHTKMMCFLYDIKDIEVREPLFTTEDGVGVFDGDEFFYLATEWGVCSLRAKQEYPNRDDAKRFSTKEAAERYLYEEERSKQVDTIMGKYFSIQFDKRRVTRECMYELYDLLKTKATN